MRQGKGRVPATALVLLLGSATSAAAQAPDSAVLIRDVTIVDGTAPGPRPGMDVILRAGRIEAIQDHQGDDPAFEGAVVDGAGRYLIPGLIDAHVHVGHLERGEAETVLRWAVEGGVTAIRDMAGDARALAGLQQALVRGRIRGPALYYSVLMAGPAFLSDPRLQAAAAGYDEGQAPFMIPLTSATDVRRAAAMARGAGATGVKLYAALDAALVEAAIREAHREGLRVWGHAAIFPARPVEILDAGIDGVSHAPYVIWEGAAPTDDFTLRARGDFDGIPVDGPDMDRVIDALARNGTVLDPTLYVFDRDPEDPLAEKRLTWGAAFTGRAHRGGVTIAAGTDGIGEPLAGALPNVHREIELLVRLAGLSPLDALVAGTWGGAAAIGITDRAGSVEVGKSADLVLLAADPLEDIRNTRDIVHVFQGGRRIR